MMLLTRSRFFCLLTLAALLLSACLPVPAPTLPASTPTQVIPATLTVTATSRPTLPPPTATRTPLPTETETVTPTPRPTPRRVLIISIDGLRPDAIALAPMPNLLALMQTSAYSLTAQTIFPSVTLPAHTSMLTGVRMEKHGITWNDWVPTNPVVSVPTVFAAAKQAGYSTAMFVAKEKFRHLLQPGTVDEFDTLSPLRWCLRSTVPSMGERMMVFSYRAWASRKLAFASCRSASASDWSSSRAWSSTSE